MEKFFKIKPVGIVNKKRQDVCIKIYDDYNEALLGLDEFSHIIIFTWLHANDTPKKRKTLRVHPRGDVKNPITGVFATRSPVRPNPIGISICALIEIKDDVLRIDGIDAFDGSPVIDIKPFMPNHHLLHETRVPDWASS